MILEEGEIVGSIAGTEGKRFKILPHVHISVALIPESFPAEQLELEDYERVSRYYPAEPA